jgi:hypothetical protein
MSIRLPDPFVNVEAPGFTSAPLASNQTLMQDFLTDGSVLQVKTGEHYWSTDITYPDLFPEEYAIIISAIDEAKRTGEYLDVYLPQVSSYRVGGSPSGTSIQAGSKGSSVTITGVNTLTGVPLAGDYFQLTGSSKKVYRITSVDTSTDGVWTLNLYPDLQITTTGAEKPIFSNILFQMAITNWNDVSNLNVDGLYVNVGLQLREAK